ncbi:MAG: GAF domain-containing protein [Chitinivibrionales bacterium]|nr:GAF domain-containing protein [Chitinivibrionales bacterium]
MVIKEINSDLSFNGVSVLYHIARVLGAGGDLEKIMVNVLEILEIHAGMNRGMITILSKDNTELILDVAHGISEPDRRRGRYRPGEGVTGKVLQSGKPIVIPKLKDEPAFLDRTGARSNLESSNIAFLCVPVKAKGNVIGTLSVDRVTNGNKDKLENELDFLEAVGDLVSQLVLERRESNERISELEKENLELRRSLEDMGRPREMIGNSSTMREVFRQIAQVSSSPTTVLICGDTGTGKELVARAIHQKSPRKDGHFIAVNCASLPESLLESELFGHEKGSFTGAVSRRIGRFEAANNGTLFLDEIGEMTPSAQSRLLRAIQEKEIQRVGGLDSVKVNVRLICATNRDLENDVKEGVFREDLYYRVNVFTIVLPPLRNRGADILLLADHFAKKYSTIHSKKISRISTPAIDMLSSYHWPGNVRELENVMERAVLVAGSNSVEGHDLPPTLQMKEMGAETGGIRNTFNNLVAAYEKELIVDALKDARGNQTEAAKILGTTKRIIQYKITKYKIDYQRFRH